MMHDRNRRVGKMSALWVKASPCSETECGRTPGWSAGQDPAKAPPDRRRSGHVPAHGTQPANDITREAGVSKGTSVYFSSKEDLFVAFIANTIATRCSLN